MTDDEDQLETCERVKEGVCQTLFCEIVSRFISCCKYSVILLARPHVVRFQVLKTLTVKITVLWDVNAL